MSQLPLFSPPRVEWEDTDPETCPHCKFTAPMIDFECLGADEGNLFCPKCGDEFTPGGKKKRTKKCT